MAEINILDRIREQSAWYGEKARSNRSTFVTFKIVQVVMAASIPVVSVAGGGNVQRWTTAILGALIGIIEAVLQLGQYQQNWLTYRATREALRREDFLHSAGAGPYMGEANPDGSMWRGLTQSCREKVPNGSRRKNKRSKQRKYKRFRVHSVCSAPRHFVGKPGLVHAFRGEIKPSCGFAGTSVLPSASLQAP